MTDEHPILAEIEALLQRGPRPELAELEDTLTAGYAAALALEGERWRIERRIGDLAAELRQGDVSAHADELALLARRRTVAGGELERLRALLVTLRELAAEARAVA